MLQITEQLHPTFKPDRNNQKSSQGLERAVECLKSQTALPILIGFLASICANIALAVLCKYKHSLTEASARSESVQRRLIQLCEDRTAPGCSCSKTECPEGWLHAEKLSPSQQRQAELKSPGSCEETGGHLTILHTVQQPGCELMFVRFECFSSVYYMIDKGSDRYWDQWSFEPDNHQSGGECGEGCATSNSHSKKWFELCCHYYSDQLRYKVWKVCKPEKKKKKQ
uniref:C-type lectin domain-containing protein n=1 Tax=Salarias fasciatus TaxID=181472 RepID=A0A672HHR5_SALFA